MRAVALLVALPAAFLYGLYLVDRSSAPAAGLEIRAAEYRIGYGLSAPPDGGWRVTELPGFVDTYPRYASVWYRIPVDESVAGTSGRLAFYAPRPNGNLTAFVNGEEIGSGGSRLPPIAHHRAPLLFEFPRGLLTDGDNELVVHRTQMNGNGSLNPFFVGPTELFLADYRKLRMLIFWTPFAILGVMLVICVVMGALFLFRRQETVYGWYALTLLFWCHHQAWELTSAVPVSNTFFWRATSFASLGGFVCLSAIFIHRFLDLRYPRVERLLLSWTVAGIAVLLVASGLGYPQYLVFARFVWVPSINLIGLYNVYRLVRGAAEKPNAERVSLLLVTWVVVVVGVRDYLWEFDLGVPGSTYYLQFAAGLVLIVFSVILMLRFARALDFAESLNRELEDKVAAKARELEANYETMQHIEAERALAAERERIMRDMHDGLGGQLMQLISVTGRDPALTDVQQGVRQALEDLRMIIDSLAPNDGDLLNVLAAFRHRAEKVVNQSGLKIRWQVRDLPRLPQLRPQRVLSILRIMQECTTNTIHHANATTITIATAYDDRNGSIQVDYRDDGDGFDPDGDTAGYGLSNMRRRALELGGELTITSGTGGTRTRLSIPIEG